MRNVWLISGLLVLACTKQATTTAPSEPSVTSNEPAPAPAEQPSEVEAPSSAEADELDAMTDEELTELGDQSGQDTAYYEARDGRRGEPIVRNAAATVEGGLDKDIVRRIVRAHINEIRACYSAGLLEQPTLTGKVVVDFTIAADGLVDASNVAETELADASVGECIAEAVMKWKFPKPAGGGEVRVRYPFLLELG
jgi:outer membrane biosynthesis protein TonB